MDRGFASRLALIAAAGFALRVVYALWLAPPTEGIFDAFYFRQGARLVADGHGFANPHEFLFRDRLAPTAEHPPLYTLFLALEWKLGLGSDAVQRASGALFGAATIVLAGLLGRRVAGPRAGLVAAALAAVYPLLVTTDGAVLSETLYIPLVGLALLIAFRLWDGGSAAMALALGAVIGLAALTRGEALLLLLLLALPAALRGGGRRWLRAGACVLGCAVVLAPWVARNWSVFDRPVLANNLGGLIAQTNCGPAYRGPSKGDLAPQCLGRRVGSNEADQAVHWRRQGLRYAGDHAGELPLVALVRLLRTWGLYEPLDAVYDAESREPTVQRIGIVAFYPIAALALWGAVLLARRREPLHLLLAPVVMVSLVSIASYGSLRLRAGAELPVVVLAAVALTALSSSKDG